MPIQILQYLAYVLQAGRIRAAASNLAHESLSLGVLQPGLHFRKHLSGSHASRVSAREVVVEVLVEVEDEISGSTVRVRDACEGGGRAT